MRLRRLPAYPVYLALIALSELFYTTVFTVTAIYRIETAGLNPLQLVLVGTALETAAFLGEIPTGVVADVYSRRLSVIIGFFLIGAGFLVEGSFPIFTAILLAQVIWGIGFTFTSGATDAWIADELGGRDVGRVYLRGAQAGQVGALAGIVISVTLASVRLNLPILVGGVLFMLLAVWLILFMPEERFHRAPREERNSWSSMSGTFRSGLRAVRGRRVLITILVIGAFFGASSEGFDRLWQANILANFTLPQLGHLKPVVWFGIAEGAALVLGLLAAEVIRRRVDTGSHRGASRALLVINGLMLGSVAVFGLAGHFGVALGAYLVTAMLREVNTPVYTAWVNQHVESKIRATVMSMASQVNAFGQIAGGPVLGAVATVYSIRAALVAASAALAPALALYARTAREPEAEAVAPAEYN